MKKKIFAILSTLCILTATSTSICLATENDNKQEEYLYFVDGVQVAEDEYPNKVTLENVKVDQAGEESETDFVYYIVAQGEIEEVSEQEYYTIVNQKVETRSTGSWNIIDSEIDSGKTKYYFKGNGDDFDVAEDEYIELTIDIEDHTRNFGVGYTGTSFGKFPVSIPGGRGAEIAFIDAIEVPGTYRVLIQNYNETTEVVNGNISIHKR